MEVQDAIGRAKSSAESRYRAMAIMTSELVWLIAISQDLGFHHK